MEIVSLSPHDSRRGREGDGAEVEVEVDMEVREGEETERESEKKEKEEAIKRAPIEEKEWRGRRRGRWELILILVPEFRRRGELEAVRRWRERAADRRHFGARQRKTRAGKRSKWEKTKTEEKGRAGKNWIELCVSGLFMIS